MSTKNIVNNVYQFPGPKALAQAAADEEVPARAVGTGARTVGPSRGTGPADRSETLTHLYVNVAGLLLGLYRANGEMTKERTLAECMKRYLNQSRTSTLVEVPPEIAADASRVTGIKNLISTISAIQKGATS